MAARIPVGMLPVRRPRDFALSGWKNFASGIEWDLMGFTLMALLPVEVGWADADKFHIVSRVVLSGGLFGEKPHF
jgi:hypothetical protein